MQGLVDGCFRDTLVIERIDIVHVQLAQHIVEDSQRLFYASCTRLLGGYRKQNGAQQKD